MKISWKGIILSPLNTWNVRQRQSATHPPSFALPGQQSHLLHWQYILDLEDKKSTGPALPPQGLRNCQQSWAKQAQECESCQSRNSKQVTCCWSTQVEGFLDPWSWTGLPLNGRKGKPIYVGVEFAALTQLNPLKGRRALWTVSFRVTRTEMWPKDDLFLLSAVHVPSYRGCSASPRISSL